MSSSTAEAAERGVRWGRVVLTLLVGGAFIALGVVADVQWRWRDIWPSVFIEVGAGIGLAGVLFALERTFVGRFVRQTRAAVSTAVRAETADLREQLDEQRTNLDRLREDVQDARAARHKAQDVAFDALEEPTRASVERALRHAEDLNAISGSFRVRASNDPTGYRMEFRQFVVEGPAGPPRHEFQLGLWSPRSELPYRSADWPEDASVTSVVDDLNRELERANLDPDAVFDPGRAFSNLRDDLVFAAEMRRGSAASRLTGQLIERFDTDLLITTAGIETATGEVLVPEAEFPDTDSAVSWERQSTTLIRDPPPAPTGVDANSWRDVIDVARRTFPIRRRPFLG